MLYVLAGAAAHIGVEDNPDRRAHASRPIERRHILRPIVRLCPPRVTVLCLCRSSIAVSDVCALDGRRRRFDASADFVPPNSMFPFQPFPFAFFRFMFFFVLFSVFPCGSSPLPFAPFLFFFGLPFVFGFFPCFSWFPGLRQFSRPSALRPHFFS